MSQHRAWFVTVPLLVFAVALTVPRLLEPDRHRLLDRPIAVAAIFALLAVSQFVVLRFDIRRQGITATLSEVPLVLALFYLPPLTVLIVRLVAGILGQIVRRAGIVRGSLNVAAFVAGIACANAVVAVYGIHDLQPRTWLVIGAAALTNFLVTFASVAAVMLVVQGPPMLIQYLRSSPTVLAVAVFNIAVGLITLLALEQSRWSVVLLAGLGIAVAIVYRAYAQFLRHHKSLNEIHQITRAITASVPEGRLADVALGRLRHLLHAETATLWLPARGRYPELLLTAMVDYRGLLDHATTPDSLRGRAFETGEPVTLAAKLNAGEDTVELRRQMRSIGAKDAIVVPLRSGNAVVGTLEVAGRLGDLASFTADDVRLVETLAAHVGVAVENSRLVDRLRFDANYDSLTGLPNRRRLLSALGEAINSRAPGEVVALLQFDVVGLRSVNESLGHQAGNEVLIEVGKRIRSLAPAASLVSRIGGDEFAVVLRAADLEAALAQADDIRAALREPMHLDAIAIDIDTTVGVAVHPEHGNEPEMLLQRADVATHTAKVGAGSQPYNAGLESRSVRRLGLAADLRRGLEQGELDVYFQPKVALGDRRVVGVECLARWEHPVYGSVIPPDFVAVAEHTGQIAVLTDLVLRHGLGRAREWADAGRALSVSVNVSPRSLADPSWPDHIGRLLEGFGVPPDRLILEVGEEGLLGESGRSIATLKRLRDMGVRLSVDDFGTGYSSLALLRRLPITEVKIDKLFVQGMATDAGDLAIVRAVVDLSRHFNLTVVAEGVESELTLARLEEIGCDVGQGFLFSRPLPHERLDAWLQARTEPQPTKSGEVRWLRAVP